MSLSDSDALDIFSLDSSVQGLDFSDSALLPFENDWLADPSDASPASIMFAGSLDPLLDTWCTSDGDLLQPYSKRNGEICVPQAPVEPLPLLNLPDLDDVERALKAIRPGSSEVRIDPIKPVPGFTRDDDESCRKPYRRLCCLGPLYEQQNELWRIVGECRGLIHFLI